jgi:hypothetical protein
MTTSPPSVLTPKARSLRDAEVDAVAFGAGDA